MCGVDFKDVFSHDDIRLPQTYEGYYPDFIKKIFDNYIEMLRNINKESMKIKYYSELMNKIPDIEDLCKSIHDALTLYYDGNVQKSYSMLEEAILKEKEYFKRLITNKKDSRIFNAIHQKGLFRARVKNDGSSLNYSKKEMFHLPFDKRHKAATARYSIPGLPCLYLGTSIYLLWQELGCPALHKLHLSHFIPTEDTSIKLLNFAYPPQKISSWGTGQWNELTFPMIVLWPMLAACSLEGSSSDAHFKPEYIVPQFLFMMDSNEELKFDAVRYFSTKMNPVPLGETGQPLNVNYAIKPKEIDKKGYCGWLKDQFQYTAPQSYELLKILTNIKVPETERGKYLLHTDEILLDYGGSEFDTVEKRLLTFDHSRLILAR